MFLSSLAKNDLQIKYVLNSGSGSNKTKTYQNLLPQTVSIERGMLNSQGLSQFNSMVVDLATAQAALQDNVSMDYAYIKGTSAAIPLSE